MKESPQYKRFKRTHFTGDTFTLSNTRSSIIRTIEGYHRYTNTAILWRLKNQTQNIEIDTPKTYLIIEIIPHLVFYSYATKYHKLSSMFVPGYQCSNVYINVEKRASINKDIQ